MSTPPRSWGARRALILRSKKREQMSTRRALVRIPQPAATWVATRMEGFGRYFSDKASGRVLSEEERAAENVYIQVMVDRFSCCCLTVRG